MAEIRWTIQAADDLQSITEFIARDSSHYARLFATNVLNAAARIALFPSSGRVVPEINDPTVRETVFGAYRVVYRQRDEYAVILTVHSPPACWVLQIYADRTPAIRAPDTPPTTQYYPMAYPLPPLFRREPKTDVPPSPYISRRSSASP